jgi:amino acid transporter
METATPATPKKLTVRQAAFIGVGSMVGAGIFSLLGTAGEVAGAAVWISFLIAGIVAMLQGYSFAKFGSRYPSAAGLLEYVRRGYGEGHFMGTLAWLILATNAIVTAMVAVSFGSYASDSFTNGSTAWVKVFAVLLVVVMSILNIGGSGAVARVQTVVVVVVITILTVFRGVDVGERQLRPARRVELSGLERHHRQRRPDVLRVSSDSASSPSRLPTCQIHPGSSRRRCSSPSESRP